MYSFGGIGYGMRLALARLEGRVVRLRGHLGNFEPWEVGEMCGTYGVALTSLSVHRLGVDLGFVK